MTAILNELKAIDADASDRERHLRDLKGLTPEFETAMDRAKHAHDQHLCLIESETEALKELRARAVELAAYIGLDALPEPDEPNEYGLKAEILETEEPAPEAEPEPTVEEITAAVEEIAASPPPEPDPSDDPELTTEQCERYEDTIREADRVAVSEPETEQQAEPAPEYADIWR